jgi:hypothetical protein
MPTPISRDAIAARLLALPGLIHEAEMRLLADECAKRRAEADLNRLRHEFLALRSVVPLATAPPAFAKLARIGLAAVDATESYRRYGPYEGHVTANERTEEIATAIRAADLSMADIYAARAEFGMAEGGER